MSDSVVQAEKIASYKSAKIREYAGREKRRIRLVCKICGRDFVAVRAHRMYCSSYCRHRAGYQARGPYQRTCQVCSVQFTAKQRDTIFCSEKCGNKNWAVNNRARVNARMREFNRALKDSAPWAYLIRGARGRAREKGLEFSLTPEWGAARWTGRCELTGIAFEFPKLRRSALSASIDRIDSSVGYTPENSRFILWGLNLIKANDTDADMMKFIEEVRRSFITNGHRG